MRKIALRQCGPAQQFSLALVEIMGHKLSRTDRQRLYTLGSEMNDSIVVLHSTVYADELRLQNLLPVSFVNVWHNNHSGVPVSSSNVTKIRPFAVPGRCRVITAPATEAFLPFAIILNSAADLICCRRI